MLQSLQIPPSTVLQEAPSAQLLQVSSRPQVSGSFTPASQLDLAVAKLIDVSCGLVVVQLQLCELVTGQLILQTVVVLQVLYVEVLLLEQDVAVQAGYPKSLQDLAALV